jgi:two-component system sensor histidine kinase YesM
MFSTLFHVTNDMKIRTKLILSFISVVFIPVLIVGVFLTSELRQMALSNALDQISTNVERVKKRTSEMLNVPYDISYRLSNDTRLEQAANSRYETVYGVFEAYREYPDFRDYARLYKEISSVRLYIDNPTLLNNWEFLQPDASVTGQTWYQAAIKGNGLIRWNYIEDNRNGQNYFSLIRKIDFLEQHTSGILVINVNMAMLNAILMQESFETMIVDRNNYIVAANRPDKLGKTLDQIDFDPNAITQTSGIHDAIVEGKTSKILIDHWSPDDSSNDLRIISVFSVESIVKDANQIIILALIVITISLIVAILLIYGFSGLLSNRLLRLSKHISKVATGNLDVVLAIDGKDEIGQLSRQFNSMVGSINELMSEVQESNKQKSLLELKQNEIKFKMMASQINPHFLFNALESIRMKSHLKGQTEIARVVRLLGKMMRKNLEVGNWKISLSNEIDTVSCYLDIQKFRYEDRLSYELVIDPKAGQVGIPPLIIQPLVENAVIHGLENREAGGLVRVEVSDAGAVVLVRVTDNGDGMSKQRIEEIYRSLEDKQDQETNRIGLRNVHLRLQLTYGTEYGLTIESEPGIGTQVSFSIPSGGLTDA